MKRLMWALLAAADAVILWVLYAHPEVIVMGVRK